MARIYRSISDLCIITYGEKPDMIYKTYVEGCLAASEALRTYPVLGHQLYYIKYNVEENSLIWDISKSKNLHALFMTNTKSFMPEGFISIKSKDEYQFQTLYLYYYIRYIILRDPPYSSTYGTIDIENIVYNIESIIKNAKILLLPFERQVVITNIFKKFDDFGSISEFLIDVINKIIFENAFSRDYKHIRLQEYIVLEEIKYEANQPGVRKIIYYGKEYISIHKDKSYILVFDPKSKEEFDYIYYYMKYYSKILDKEWKINILNNIILRIPSPEIITTVNDELKILDAKFEKSSMDNIYNIIRNVLLDNYNMGIQILEFLNRMKLTHEISDTMEDEIEPTKKRYEMETY